MTDDRGRVEAGRPDGYSAARGSVPWREGDLLPEEAIRRVRGGDADAPREEVAALRAAVARLEGERDDERRQRLLYEDDIRGYVADIDRLTAARDMARATLDAERLAGRAELERERARVRSHAALLRYAALLRRVAHEVLRHPGELDTCQRDDCPGLRRAVARAGAATGGDDGGR